MWRKALKKLRLCLGLGHMLIFWGTVVVRLWLDLFRVSFLAVGILPNVPHDNLDAYATKQWLIHFTTLENISQTTNSKTICKPNAITPHPSTPPQLKQVHLLHHYQYPSYHLTTHHHSSMGTDKLLQFKILGMH